MAGNERPVQIKLQMLWICIFPFIHAVLLQNVRVKCCQILLSWVLFVGWIVAGFLTFRLNECIFSCLVNDLNMQITR